MYHMQTVYETVLLGQRCQNNIRCGKKYMFRERYVVFVIGYNFFMINIFLPLRKNDQLVCWTGKLKPNDILSA